MAQILQIVERILEVIATVLGVLGVIRTQTEHGAQDHFKYELLGYAAANSGYLLDTSTGLAAIAAKIDALTSTGAYNLSDVLNAIADTQQAGSPVTFPTVLTSGQKIALAEAIWSYFSGAEPRAMGEWMVDAGHVARALKLHGNYLPDSWYQLMGSPIDVDATANPVPGGAVTVLESTALAGETLLANLQRRYPLWTWAWASGVGSYVQGTNPDLYPAYAQTTITGWEWDRRLALLAGARAVTTSDLPPIWPGLSGVTTLTPVTITPPGDVINVACEGVVVDITAVPAWAGSFSFGADISYRNIGAVTFQTDDGHDEFPIQLGWVAGVYLPRAMAKATRVAYRAAVGVAGTITPFTIP